MKPLKSICLFIPGMLACALVSAQNLKIDSLYKDLKSIKEDTSKVKTLNALSYEFENVGEYHIADSIANKALLLSARTEFHSGMATAYKQIGSIYDDQGDYVKALDYFLKCLSLKKQLNDKKGIAVTLNRIGLVYNKQSEYFQATGYLLEALKAFKELDDKPGIAEVEDNIGTVYTNKGDYAKALEELFNALKVFEDMANKHDLANVHEHIGNVYNEQGDYNKAIAEHLKALKIREDLGDKNNIANSLSNIGLAYLELGKDSLALEYYNKCLEIRKGIGVKDGIAISIFNIGGVYSFRKKHDVALEYFAQALNIFNEVGNKNGVANCYDAFAQTYLAQKNYNDALECENKSLALATQIGSQEGIETAHQMLSSIYDSIGNDKQAFIHYKEYIVARDSIFNKENTQKSIQTELNYQFEKKQDAEKAEQEKKDAIHNEEVKKQKIVIYSICGILVLALVFAAFAYRSYLQKQRANKELDIKNKKIELAYQVIETKNKDITDSINYAKRIQTAILVPKEEIAKSISDFFILYKPKDIVSGDFYFFTKKNQTLYIAAADCTGHGVPGAFMSLIGWEKLSESIEQNENPGNILNLLNKGIKTALRQSNESDTSRDGMDIALCSMKFFENGNGKECSLIYSGANRPIWITRNNATEIEEIKATKHAIGGFEVDDQLYDSHEIKLKKGDSFYIFSDGYADQFGGEREKKVTTKKLKELIITMQNKAMHEQEKHLDDFIENWKAGRGQIDDILVIGVKV